MTLRILCLNAWGGRLHAPLMPYLADTDPDVLCLQEVTHVAGHVAGHLAKDGDGWLTFRDGSVELPQRARLLDDVSAVLPGHRAFFAPRRPRPVA